MPRPDHLMLAHDGSLYDTRRENWMFCNPLRYRYAFSKRTIENVADLKACLRAGKTTDLGGYPLFFLCKDGTPLSFEVVASKAHLGGEMQAIKDRSPTRIVACEINYEDNDLTCAYTGERIPSAYGDDE